ncbi:MAG: hypothetical protein N2234_03940 [Planctomycetota bacterium]|nr:hypothetical protein [Planctomycetota bacterium]
MVTRKGSFKFFGNEFLKPKGAEEAPAGSKEPVQKPESERKEKKALKKNPLLSFLGWLIAAVCAAVSFYFFNLNIKQKEEIARISADSTSLKESIAAFFESPPNIISAYTSLVALSERPTHNGKWAREVLLKTGNPASYRLKLLGALASQAEEGELERTLGAKLTKLAEERLRNFSNQRILSLLGDERSRSLTSEILAKMSEAELSSLLSRRQETLTRAFIEKMGDERFELLFSDKLLTLFRSRLAKIANNLSALESLLGTNILSDISKTCLNTLPPESLVPAVEDNFERLAAAVEKWRKEHAVKVTLKNGDMLEGVLLERTETGLLIRTKDGKKSVLLSEVAKLEGPGAK